MNLTARASAHLRRRALRFQQLERRNLLAGCAVNAEFDPDESDALLTIEEAVNRCEYISFAIPSLNRPISVFRGENDPPLVLDGGGQFVLEGPGSPSTERCHPGFNPCGVMISGSGITVKGMVIRGWNNAITIEQAQSVTLVDNIIVGNGVGIRLEELAWQVAVQRNFIGVAADGRTAVPNSVGIYSEGPIFGVLIGGEDPGAGNVISGNTGSGIALQSDGGSPQSLDTIYIQGNLIGTSADGLIAVPNGGGLHVRGKNVLVGGTAPGAGNVISGNVRAGSISGQGINVQGNYVGTDITSRVALGNGEGLSVSGEALTGGEALVGGTLAGSRNLFSGNETWGVSLGNNVRFEGNYVGTDVTGSIPIPNGDGVHMSGSGAIVGGLEPGMRNLISGNRGRGVVITGNVNKVEGNFIGTNLTGTAAMPNQHGIEIDGNFNVVGGQTPASRNVISGNRENGIEISRGDDNVIQGNFIGTDVEGGAAIPNQEDGVRVTFLGERNRIGGDLHQFPNIISGNGEDGVSIDGNDTLVAGNIIGGRKDGSSRLGNGTSGVYLSGSRNTVGGALESQRNIIIANGDDGVFVAGTASKILGNFIGVGPDGERVMGNDGDGIQVAGDDNEIGGESPGEGNRIAFNSWAGVFVSTGERNSIRRNEIFGNGELPIDLAPRGPAGVDAADSDSGANQQQNHPELISVSWRSQEQLTRATGTIQSAPSSTFELEFFSYSSSDATFAQKLLVATDVNGIAKFAATLPPSSRPVMVTATDQRGNTSEAFTSNSSLLFRSMEPLHYDGTWIVGIEPGVLIPGFDHVALHVDDTVYEATPGYATKTYWDAVEQRGVPVSMKNGVQSVHTRGSFLHQSTIPQDVSPTVSKWLEIFINPVLAASMRDRVVAFADEPYFPISALSILSDLDSERQKNRTGEGFSCVGLIERAAEDVGALRQDLVPHYGFVPDQWESILRIGVPTLSPWLLSEVLLHPEAGSVLLGVFDPIDYALVDPDGRRLGFTKALGVVNEIPNAAYTGDGLLEQFMIFDPVPGAYSLALVGLDSDGMAAVGGMTTEGTQFLGHLGLDETRHLEFAVAPLSLWTHGRDSLDVDQSGVVVPLDVLLVVNRLNRGGSSALPPPEPGASPPPYYDASGDGHVTPLDALLIINYLNRQSSLRFSQGEPGHAEGEENGADNALAPSAIDRLLSADLAWLFWEEGSSVRKSRITRQSYGTGR